MFASAPDRPRRRIAWDLALVLAAYVLLRALALHTNFDQFALWMYELYPMGTMAEFLQRGVDFPLRFYYDNAAGQLLSGFLTVPCFALAGPSYLTLKLVPFALGIGVLLLSWSWLRASHGRLAANLAAWSLVLAPTTYFKYSLTNSGNHFENLFWSLLAVAACARLARLGVSPTRLFVAGCAAGFALFVFLGALLPVGILCALHFVARGPRAALRDLAWAAPGFLVGLLPLVLVNVVTGARGLGFLDAKFGAESSAVAGGPLFERMADYLGAGLASAGTYPDALLSGASGNFLLCAALVLAWFAALPFAWHCLRRGGEDQVLVLYAAYVPLSALAFGLSNLRLRGHSGAVEYGGYRYYLPLLLFGMLAAAALAAKAWRAGGAWRAGIALVALGILLPGLANVSLVNLSAEQTGLGSRYSGYDLSKAARGLLGARNGLDRAEQVRYLERFPPPLRATVTRAIGFNLAAINCGQARRTEGEVRWSLDLCALLAEWPEALRPELARGAGIGMRFVAGASEASALLPALRRTLARGADCPERLNDFLTGLASVNPALPLASQVEAQSAGTNGLIGLALTRELPEPFLKSLVRGQGLFFGQLARRGIPSDLAALARRRGELPPQFQEDFDRGLGQGCALEGEELGVPESPFEAPAPFWPGFVGELRAVWASEPAAIEARLDELERTLAPALRAALHAAR